MLKVENAEVMGWEHAIRGMRNPKNSWEKSDSGVCARMVQLIAQIVYTRIATLTMLRLAQNIFSVLMTSTS